MNSSAICPSCGETLPPISDAFCPACHEPLEFGSPETSVARQAASPKKEPEAVEYRPKNRASESISGSRTLGYLAGTGAIVVAFVFSGLAAYSLNSLFTDYFGAPESGRSEGWFMGGLSGVLWRTLIGYAIAIGLYAFARRQLDPANHSRRGRMKQIIEATNDVSTDDITADNAFANCSDIELLHHFRQSTESKDDTNLAELAYEARKRIDA